jgi:hypothetical protein
LYAGTSWTDPFKIIWNGLPLDLSLAGYLTAIPGLFFIASAWTLSKALRRIWNGYYFFIAILLAVIFIVDIGLYEYWGFRLDATPLFYFFSSPKDALASISIYGGAGRDSSYDPVCIIALRSFSWDTERYLEKDETALSPIVGVRCNAVTDRFALYSYPWRFYCFYNEHRQSLFQFQPTLEPCSYQSGIQLDGISIQAKRFRQAISFYGSGTGG